MPEQSIVGQHQNEVTRPRRKLWVAVVLLFGIAAMCAGAVGLWKHYTSPLVRLTSKARGGDPVAAFELGKAYATGTGGAPKDAQQALRWYKQAAEAGERRAENNLGMMYWRGDGVSKDYKAAFNWFRKSAEQGDMTGEWNLARAYNLGLGEPQNFAESFTWMKKAAENGHEGAQLGLCAMYVLGRGLPKDPTIGYAWCLVSKASGSIRLKFDRIEQLLSPSQVSEAQALASSWWSARQEHSHMPDNSRQFGKVPSHSGQSLPHDLSGRSPRHPGSGFDGMLDTSGCESGHWVDSVSGEGSIVRLEDGSVWKISDIDTIDTLLWLPTEDIVVCDGKLINTDSGDSVDAARVK